MTDQNNQVVTVNSFKSMLHKNYMTQFVNFLGDEKKALKFLSAISADIQRNPKLLEATPASLINSYITMAELGFMPSNVSGEGYVIVYENSKKEGGAWIKVKEAQFQMGYQGLVTLFYKSGIERIISEIVYSNDSISFVNGEIKHEIDIFKSSEERGDPVGAYVIVTYKGKDNVKYMNGKDIIAYAQKYSKSYDPKGKYSPWNPDNDGQKWMWRKTVLKQHSKLLPKNETINKAINEDNKDSTISDAIKMVEKNNLSMGNFLKEHGKKPKEIEGDKEEAPTTTGDNDEVINLD